MSIGLPRGALSWLSVTLGVATGGAGTSFRRHAERILVEMAPTPGRRPPAASASSYPSTSSPGPMPRWNASCPRERRMRHEGHQGYKGHRGPLGKTCLFLWFFADVGVLCTLCVLCV